jgi:SNF2 family DNA or RNA helicase
VLLCYGSDFERLVLTLCFSIATVVLLDKLLPKLRQEGHKILIFSQMVRMLDLISEYCELREFRYERLDGRIRGSERQKAIDRFEREDDSFLFLLSTRAGGVGINLVSATVCILFDRYVHRHQLHACKIFD